MTILFAILIFLAGLVIGGYAWHALSQSAFDVPHEQLEDAQRDAQAFSQQTADLRLQLSHTVRAAEDLLAIALTNHKPDSGQLLFCCKRMGEEIQYSKKHLPKKL